MKQQMNEPESIRRSRRRLVHVVLAFVAAGLLGFTASTTLSSLATRATEAPEATDGHGRTRTTGAPEAMDEHGRTRDTGATKDGGKSGKEPAQNPAEGLDGPGGTEPGRARRNPGEPGGTRFRQA